MSPFFFLHVPKTGGTSLREAALQHFGNERVLLLYGSDSRTTSEPVKEVFWSNQRFEDRLRSLNAYILSHDIHFVSSHLAVMARLACFDTARALTLLRNPVERVISSFEFKVRKQNLTGTQLNEFVEQAENCNVQARTLQNVDLRDLGAVGITEAYSAFLDYAGQALSLPLGELKRNRQNWMLKAMRRTIPQDLRARIDALNKEDADLYRQACSIWRQNAATLRTSAA